MILMLPSGKRLHSYGKSPCLMGKSTISMAIFHSYFDITRGYRYRSYGLHWHMTCGKVERSHRAFKMMVNFVPSGKRLRN